MRSEAIFGTLAPIFYHSTGNPSNPILTGNFRARRHGITRNKQNRTNTRRDRVDQSSRLAWTRRHKSQLGLDQDLGQDLWTTLSLRVFVKFCSFRVISCLQDVKFTPSIGFDGLPFLLTKIGAKSFFYAPERICSFPGTQSQRPLVRQWATNCAYTLKR